MRHPSNQQSLSGLLSRLAYAFLRLFFNLLYHQFAWAYDWVAYAVSLGRWQSWVKTTLPYITGPTVLEIGFGPGHLQVPLLSMDVVAFGIDESWQMIRLTAQRMQPMDKQSNLIRGIAQQLPFMDRSINQVVMTFPSDFLLKKETFFEIQRILTPGGSVVIVPMAWLTGGRPIERLVAWVSRIAGESPVWNVSYLELLKEFGFEVSWEMVEVNSSRLLIIQLVNPVKHPAIPSESG